MGYPSWLLGPQNGLQGLLEASCAALLLSRKLVPAVEHDLPG